MHQSQWQSAVSSHPALHMLRFYVILLSHQLIGIGSII